MHVDAASHAPHGRKHGATFAESFRSADGATIVAVGDVLAGQDPIAVSDLLRAGARALVTKREALGTALAALDRVVRNHAHEHRDDTLAAAIALFAFAPDGHEFTFVGAGQLHCAILHAIAGERTPLHGHAVALGTGIPAGSRETTSQTMRLRGGDIVVAATIPIDVGWLTAHDHTAEQILLRAGAPEASVAIVTIE